MSRPAISTRWRENEGPGYHVYAEVGISNIDQDYVPSGGWMSVKQARAFARAVLREADRIEDLAAGVRRDHKRERERARGRPGYRPPARESR